MHDLLVESSLHNISFELSCNIRHCFVQSGQFKTTIAFVGHEEEVKRWLELIPLGQWQRSMSEELLLLDFLLLGGRMHGA